MQEDIDRVKRLYEEMEMPHIYAKYEEETFNTISKNIQQLSCGLPKDFFYKCLSMFFTREV
jgi:hypothetical protein